MASGGLGSTHGGIVWLSHLLSYGGGLWWPAKYTRWYRVVVSLVILRRWPVVAWEVTRWYRVVVSLVILRRWPVVACEVHTVVSCGCLTCYLTEVASGGLGITHGGIVWLSHLLSHGGGQWWPGKYTRWYRVVVSLVISRRWPGKYTRWYRVVVSLVISRRWPVVAWEVHTVVSCGCLTCYLTEVAWEVHMVVSCGCLTCYLTEVASGGLGSTHGGIV